MRSVLITAAIGLAALTAGCATSGQAPIDATRYHLSAPLVRGPISVEPATGADAVSLEYRSYLDAIHSQLLANGYSDPAPGGTAPFIATVSLRRAARGSVQEPSPFQIGIGGGSYSGGRHGGVGLGGGVSFPIGKGRTRDIVQTELWVQIRSRGDGAALWEGRAVTESLEPAPAGAQIAPERLAAALFQGFPGESGITITVK
ncbi:hypothetical protein BH09PSE4_BH09PSE4_08990 [soil metagenome]